MASGFAAAAANIRNRVSELDRNGAGSPAQWGWSGRAAGAYSRTWQSWKLAADAVADNMDSNRPGARQILAQLADELEAAQSAYDSAVGAAQGIGLGVDSNGYVSPRSVAAPGALPAGSPEQQIEEELANAARLGRQALEWAGERFTYIFKDGLYEAAGRMNDLLGWPTTPPTVLQSATATYAGVKYWQSARNLPGLAARLFSEEVGPVGLAYDRGEATFTDLSDAARIGFNRVNAANAFTRVADRASFLRSGVAEGGALDLLGKALIPVAVATDLMTIANPGHGGAFEQGANRGAAILNLAGTVAMVGGMAGEAGALGGVGALLAADAALGWVPVAGQVLVVATGLFLAADWAYNNVQPFHDFVNTAASDTAHVAQEAWNTASQGVSNVGHSVSNAFSGAAHAVTSFFHWP